MAVADYTTLVQQIYISYFGRPADPLGLFNYAATLDAAKAPTTAAGLATAYNTVPSIKALVDSFAAAPESVALYGSASNLAFVTSIYANVLNRTPDVAGLTYWVGEVASGRVSKAAAALNIMNGALENKSAQGLLDAKVLANKVTISNNFDAVLNSDGVKLSSYDGDAAAAAAREMLKTVTATTDVTSFQASINSTIDGLVAKPNVGVNLALGVGIDNLVGTVGNDTIVAKVVDNQNTLQNSDKINGGAGVDRLDAEIALSQKFAIMATTSNVETVAIHAQSVGNDSNNNNMVDPVTGLNYSNHAQIDAQNMVGVTQWESNNSRADVVIEDIRILDSQITKDITIAMVETDAGHVDLGVYFDQYSLRAQSNTSSELHLQIMDTRSVAQGRGPLEQSPYDGFVFNYKGVATTVRSPAIDAAQTYDDLLIAVKAALASNPALSSIVATLGNNFTVLDSFGAPVTGREIVLKTTNGDTLDATQVPGGTTLGWVANGAVPPSSGLFTNMIPNAPTTTVDLVTAKIILDDVGRGSTGGDLVVGGLSVGDTSSSKGVQRFEIEVRDNSKLETINSTNNSLKEVTIASGVTTSKTFAYDVVVKDKGNLTVNGTSGFNGSNITNGGAKDAAGTLLFTEANGFNGVYGSENGALPGSALQTARGFGFSDVRLIDATGFQGKLAFSAEVTAASIAKYMNLKDVNGAAVADNVDFAYTGGTNDDTMYVRLDSTVVSSNSNLLSGREDFTFTANGGAGNDEINVGVVNGLNGGAQAWYTNQKLNANIKINGGDGNDTIRTPGAGDKIIDGGTGNDTIYSDNSGTQGVTSNAVGASGPAAAAYTTASAAELAAAIAVTTLANATDALIAVTGTTAVVGTLDTLNLFTPVAFPAAVITHANMATAIATAFTNGGITLAQRIALDTAYNVVTGETATTPNTLTAPTVTGGTAVAGNLTAAEFAAGNTLLDTYIAAAKSADAVAIAADANKITHDALLNATQLAVQADTIAMTGIAGTTTKVTNLAALNSALILGATDAQVVAALQAAVKNGAILAGQDTTLFNAATSVGAGTVDAAELQTIQLTLTPLMNTAANANAAAATTLATDIAANIAAVRAEATVVGITPVNPTPLVGQDGLGVTGTTAAVTAANVALNTFNATTVAVDTAKVADLAALKSAIIVGTTELAVSIATTNAVAKNAITGADKIAIDNAANAAAPTAAGVVDATEKTNVDLAITALQLAADKAVATDAQIAADLASTVTATTLAAAQAAAAAASGGSSLSLPITKGVYVLNTANQANVADAGYVLAQNDERNLADLKSDVNDSYNMFQTKVMVSFKGIDVEVAVNSTNYKTTDLQINQAIKAAINAEGSVMSKLLVATDGPANSLVITSLIDGALTLDNLSVKLSAPVTGVLTAADIAGAAAAYGFVGTATEATLTGAAGYMTLAKVAFDTKGDYLDQFAETGAASGNIRTTGANSLSSTDNTITGGAGNDVIVLSTTVQIDKLASSNENVVFASNFGNDTIVNFSATGLGIDTLDFNALGGSGSVTFGSLSANKSIVVGLETTANDTAAEISALFTDSATAATHVYVAYDAGNIGKVYAVTDAAGVAATGVVATLVGTIDLADTAWATLTAANFA